MALRRQGLSQRRKAVGLTQESLAEHLGVERSTVVRWEAGDTEPLPSIRPKMARVLHVSIDQLAELLTESENAETTRALSAGAEVMVPVLLPEVQSDVRPVRAEFENLIRPQVAEAVEALRRALRSAGVGPADLDAMLLFGRSSRVDVEPDTPVPTTIEAGGFAGSDIPEPAQSEVPHRPSLTAIPLDVEPAHVQRSRARSRWFTWFAAAGVLAFVFTGGAASVLFITSPSGPILPTATGTPAPAAPVAAIRAPDPGNSNDNNLRSEDSTGAVHATPAGAPNKPTDGPAPPGAAAVAAPHTTRSDNRTNPPASMTTPALPRIPAIPAQAYAWSHTVALSASDQHRTRLRPNPLSRP
jgi:transcriptional regulator with XRE-family HTH domain